MQDDAALPPRPRTASSVRSNEHIRRALAFERAQLLRSRKKAMEDKSGARKKGLRRRGSFGSGDEESGRGGYNSSSMGSLHRQPSDTTMKRPSTSGGRQHRQRDANEEGNAEFSKWLAATLPAAPITGVSGLGMREGTTNETESTLERDSKAPAHQQSYSLFVWGQNGHGQCGSSCAKPHLTRPRRLGQHNLRVHSVVAGTEFSFAVKDGGSMLGWGVLSEGLALASAKTPVRAGSDSARELQKEQNFRQGPVPRSVVSIHPIVVPGFEELKLFEVAAQSDGRCVAITTRLETVSWHIENLLHDDSSGRSSSRSRKSVRASSPALAAGEGAQVRIYPVSGLEHIAISTVACGRNHTIALSCAGGVYGWGSNARGQLGRPSSTDGESGGGHAAGASAIDLGRGTYCRLVTCGDDHTLVLAYNSVVGQQQLLACGAADLGQLGLGGEYTSLLSSSMLPVNFPPTSASSLEEIPAVSMESDLLVATIAAGGDSSFCLTESGVAFAWGDNRCGQLGLGDTEAYHAPTAIQSFLDVGLKVETISCSGKCSAAVSTAGNVYTWGQIRAEVNGTKIDGGGGGGGGGGGSSGGTDKIATSCCELVPRLVELFAAKNLRIAGVWAGRGNQFVAAVRSLSSSRRGQTGGAMPEIHDSMPSAPKCVALFEGPPLAHSPPGGSQRGQQSPTTAPPPPSPSSSLQLQSATVDEWASCIVELRDFRGELVHTGGWRLSVSLYCSEKGSPLRGGPQSLSPDADTEVIDNWNGTYQVRFRSHAIGIHQLHVRLHDHPGGPLADAPGFDGAEMASGGMHIHRSPFQVLVQQHQKPPSPLDYFSFDVTLMPNRQEEDNDDRNFIRGPVSMAAQDDRAVAMVRVSAVEEKVPPLADASGLWGGLQLDAEAKLTSGLALPRDDLMCTVQRASMDRFLITYPARHSGTFALVISARVPTGNKPPAPSSSETPAVPSNSNAEEIPGSPFVYTVTPGPLSHRTTQLRRAPSHAGSTITLTIDARDEFGNPVVATDAASALVVEGMQISSQTGVRRPLDNITLEPPAPSAALASKGEWRITLSPTDEACQVTVHVQERSSGRGFDVAGSPMVIHLGAAGEEGAGGLQARGWRWAPPDDARGKYFATAPGETLRFCVDFQSGASGASDASDREALQAIAESAVSVRAVEARTGVQSTARLLGSFMWDPRRSGAVATCGFEAAAPLEAGVYRLELLLGGDPMPSSSASGGLLSLSVVDAAALSFHLYRRLDLDHCLFRRDSSEAFHFVVEASPSDEPAVSWLALPRTLDGLANGTAQRSAVTIRSACTPRELSACVLLPLGNVRDEASWRAVVTTGGGGGTDTTNYAGSDAEVVMLCVSFDATEDSLLERLVGYAQVAVSRIPAADSDDAESFRTRVGAIGSLVGASVGACVWDVPPGGDFGDGEADDAGSGEPSLRSFRCVVAPAGCLCREAVAARRRGVPVAASRAFVWLRAVLFKYLCDAVGIPCGVDFRARRRGDEDADEDADADADAGAVVWVVQRQRAADEAAAGEANTTRGARFAVDLDHHALHEVFLRRL